MPAEIRVKARLDGSEMKTGLQQLGNDAKSFATNQIGSIKTAIGSAFAIGMIIDFGKAVIDLGSQVSDTAKQVGISTDALQGLNAAAIENGSSADALHAAFSKLKDKQGEVINGNKSAIESFQRLGISAEDVAGMELEKLFERVGQQTANAADETVAYNATIDILGKGAGELNQTLKAVGSEGLQGIIDQAKDAGEVMDAAIIQKLDQAGDRIDSAILKFKVFGAEVLNFSYEASEALGDFFDGFSKSGGNFSDAMIYAQQAGIERLMAQEAEQLKKKEFEEKQAAQRIADMQKAQAEEAAKAQLKIDEQNAKERAKLEKDLQDAKEDIISQTLKKQSETLKAQIKEAEEALSDFQSKMNNAAEDRGVTGRRAIDMAIRETNKENREEQKRQKAIDRAVSTAEKKLKRIEDANPGLDEQAAMEKLSDTDRAALEMFGKKGKKAGIDAQKQGNRDPSKDASLDPEAKKRAAEDALKKMGEPASGVPTTGTAGAAETASAGVTTSGVSVSVNQDSVVEVLKEISGKLDAIGWLGKWTGSGS